MSKRPNIQVNITQDVHDRFKLACTFNKKNMGDVIRKFINRYIKRSEK